MRDVPQKASFPWAFYFPPGHSVAVYFAGNIRFSLKLIDIAKPLFLKAFGETEPAPELDILLTFEMAGVVGVYTRWCANGRKQPLEDVIHVLQRILQAGFQDVRAAAHALQ